MSCGHEGIRAEETTGPNKKKQAVAAHGVLEWHKG